VATPEWVEFLRNTVFLTFLLPPHTLWTFAHLSLTPLSFVWADLDGENRSLTHKCDAECHGTRPFLSETLTISVSHQSTGVFSPQTRLTFTFFSALIWFAPVSQVHFPLSFARLSLTQWLEYLT